MAEILDQKAIDALLSEMNGDGPSKESTDKEEERPFDPSMIKRPPKRYIPRSYSPPYESPIIKARYIAMNPEFDMDSDRNRIVVRTLRNYAAYVKHQRRSSNAPPSSPQPHKNIAPSSKAADNTEFLLISTPLLLFWELYHGPRSH